MVLAAASDFPESSFKGTEDMLVHIPGNQYLLRPQHELET